jgi:hypothetical protein
MANSYGPKSIVTQGLIFAADAGNIQCFTQGASTCKDLIQGATGTLTNQTAYSPEGGGSWEFDGTTDDIDFGDSVPVVADLEYNSSFTFMHWHNQDAIGVYHGLLSRAVAGGTYRGIIQTISDANKYNAQLIHTLSNRCNKSTTAAFSAGIWYHTGFTYDGSSNASGLKLYVNGVEAATTTASDTLGSNTIKGYDLVLGDREGGALDMDGKSTLALVYNRTLTASEVLQNYNAQKTRFGL